MFEFFLSFLKSKLILNMKYSKDRFKTWERQVFDEVILQNLDSRQRAEIETERDLMKPIEQLLCDVHEETHNESRSELANLASAQKRMVSMMARVEISNNQTNRILIILTIIIGILTFIMTVLAFK